MNATAHLRALRHHARVAAGIAGAAIDPLRPLVANLIVTRRCNLSCGYCFEYDKVSPPVPRAVLEERIDHLARLRTVFVTLTGGETLLHPEIVEIVAYVRAKGMTPMMNTNGYLLNRARIEALGKAGLYAMQISVDNVTPNATTKKSLKPLLPKLKLLARYATFKVRVNTVLGSGPPEEALQVARVVTELGLDAKVSLVRGADGAPLPLDARGRAVHDEIQRMTRTTSHLSEDFQVALLRDGTVEWKCRAGARFFHVCEDGLVHLCAPRVGAGAKPLVEYGEEDIRRAFDTRRPCAAACPIAYAHQASRLDGWRPQRGVESAPAPRREDGRVRLAVVA